MSWVRSVRTPSAGVHSSQSCRRYVFTGRLTAAAAAAADAETRAIRGPSVESSISLTAHARTHAGADAVIAASKWEPPEPTTPSDPYSPTNNPLPEKSSPGQSPPWTELRITKVRH